MVSCYTDYWLGTGLAFLRVFQAVPVFLVLVPASINGWLAKTEAPKGSVTSIRKCTFVPNIVITTLLDHSFVLQATEECQHLTQRHLHQSHWPWVQLEQSELTEKKHNGK